MDTARVPGTRRNYETRSCIELARVRVILLRQLGQMIAHKLCLMHNELLTKSLLLSKPIEGLMSRQKVVPTPLYRIHTYFLSYTSILNNPVFCTWVA